MIKGTIKHVKNYLIDYWWMFVTWFAVVLFAIVFMPIRIRDGYYFLITNVPKSIRRVRSFIGIRR